MRKQWFVVAVMLLVLWLVAGCGVAQEQHDAVVSDLGKAQQELQSVEAELGATQAKVSELTSSLEKGKTELEAAQAELEVARTEHEAFKSDVKSTWSRFDKIVGLEWFIVGYWSAAAQGDEELVEQRTVKMVTYVEPVGDSVLNSLWQQAMDAAGKGQETLFLESFAAMMDRNSKLLSDQAKAIRSNLAD